MRRSLLFLMLLLAASSAVAQTYPNAPRIFTQPGIAIVGLGCSTMFYYDPLCKPCATGMKSTGAPKNVGYWNSTSTYQIGDWVTYQGDPTYVNRSYWKALAINTNSAPAGSGGSSTNANWQESPTPYAGYMLVQQPAGAGVPAYYSMGDTPDADPPDPNVCTTAQWQAKWGWTTPDTTSDNTAMENFLNTDFDGGFTNTPNKVSSAHIFYVSTTGNNSTAVADDPTHPYATISCIMVATGSGCNTTVQPQIDTSVQNFSNATVQTTSGSPIITVTCGTGGCTGTLARSSVVSASSVLPSNDYVIEQISGTSGGAGQYLLTTSATATGSGVAVTGGYQPGGVIVIRGGQYQGCSATPAPPCLSFQPGAGGNVSWELSGSPGHPLLITSYPGEVVTITSTGQGTDVFEMQGTYNPKRAACCLIVNGIEFSDPIFQHGDLGVFSGFTDVTFERDEWAGWDNIQFSNGTARDVLRYNVGHDIYAHFRYDDWSSGCQISNPGVDTNFAQDDQNFINYASNSTPTAPGCGVTKNNVTYRNIVYDSCYEGYDCIHLNGWGVGEQVIQNVVAYSGYPVVLNTGQSDATIQGNLFFDDASECVLVDSYANHYATATFSARTNQISVTPLNAFGSTIFGAAGDHLYGPPGYLPAGPYPNGLTITTPAAGSGTGMYTLSGNTLVAAASAIPLTSGTSNGDPGPSTLRWNSIVNNYCLQTNPSNMLYGGQPAYGIRVYEQTGTSYIKNLAIKNNVIATYNNQSGFGQMPLAFLTGAGQVGGYTEPTTSGDFPETDTITGNEFYNRDTTACSGSSCTAITGDVMYLDSGASQSFPSGTYVFSGGSGCSPSTGSFSGCFSGNIYETSDPFSGCPESDAQTPWLCTFNDANGKPLLH